MLVEERIKIVVAYFNLLFKNIRLQCRIQSSSNCFAETFQKIPFFIILHNSNHSDLFDTEVFSLCACIFCVFFFYSPPTKASECF